MCMCVCVCMCVFYKFVYVCVFFKCVNNKKCPLINIIYAIDIIFLDNPSHPFLIKLKKEFFVDKTVAYIL